MKYSPLAFTEHGAVMAANVLNSPRAVQVSIFVVRAFLRLRTWVRGGPVGISSWLEHRAHRVETAFFWLGPAKYNPYFERQPQRASCDADYRRAVPRSL